MKMRTTEAARLCAFLPAVTDRSSASRPAMDPPTAYGLGMWMVLLVIRQPCSMKTSTMGWTSSRVPENQVPPGTESWIWPE